MEMKLSISLNEIIQSKLHSIDMRLILMSLSFCLLTLPSSILGYDYGAALAMEGGREALLITDCLLFSYHALNCFLFFYSANKLI